MRKSYDNDNDNDTQRSQSNCHKKTWPYRREYRRNNPAKKSLLEQVWLALLARFALGTQLNDSVQYVESR